METLSDKLKSLGVRRGAQGLSQPKPQKARYPIEEVVAGFDDETPLGTTWIAQQNYEVDYQHGSIMLCRDCRVGFLAEWCRCENLLDAALQDYIFLDTETSGLAGGTGTYAFMIGLGFRTDSGFRLLQLFMRDPSQEPALLASLSRILAQFRAVVTFNGRGFDVPLMKSRHVLNGIPHPFDTLEHIDMLPVARKLWRNRLPSRALKSLEVDILGLLRSSEEVPGYLIPEMYFDYLRSGDARPMSGIFYHNGMDILSLAALFIFVNDLLVDPLSAQRIDSHDLVAIARMHEDHGNIDQAVSLYERAIEQGLPRPFFAQTLQRFAQLYRRQGLWEGAIQLWKKSMLEYQQIEAGIELAKYYEHRQRDFDKAMYWTKAALELAADADLAPSYRRVLVAELQHRIDRLSGKMN
jgi:uncharacterized protein YprB with RNaseH-like and TPR domain